MSSDERDDLVLDQLRASLSAEQPATERFLSGSELARMLGVTRAAIGKRISALRRRGWQIDAVPRLGYRLVAEPHSIEALVVEPRLETRWVGHPYHHLQAVGSTNDALARLAADGAPHGSVIAADEQTHGRGRLGRVWESPPGANLTFSLLLRPGWAPARIPPLSLAVAVAIANGLAPFLDVAPTVKWPNDLLVERRKIAGILIEMAAELDAIRHIVVGVGVNVNQTRFSPDLRRQATSMRKVVGAELDRADVLQSLLAALEQTLEPLLADDQVDVLDDWLALADWMGERVTVNSFNGSIKGVAVGIDTQGALRVRDDRGEEHRIVAGDLLLGE